VRKDAGNVALRPNDRKEGARSTPVLKEKKTAVSATSSANSSHQHAQTLQVEEEALDSDGSSSFDPSFDDCTYDSIMAESGDKAAATPMVVTYKYSVSVLYAGWTHTYRHIFASRATHTLRITN
jgi:hypothetical protein